MRSQQQRGAAIALAAITAVLAGAGCGSSSNSTDSSHIRAVNVAVNAGNASVTVNGGAVDGNLAVGQVSKYNFIGKGDSTFGFTTDVALGSLVQLRVGPTLALNNGSYYTGYLIGRTDVTNKNTDPKFLQSVVTGDRGAAVNYTLSSPYAAPPSGSANIRVLNAAPDAGPVDVLINGKIAYAAVAYPVFPTVPVSIPPAKIAPAVNPVTAYIAVPASGQTIQVNAAGTGTVLVTAAPFVISSGNVYTVVITEPTVVPTLTYGLVTVTD